MTYTNETDGEVVITGCRVGGSTQFLNATDLPITVKAKGQASLSFLVPEKNQSKKAGSIELTVKYSGLQMTSYYYIMDENFGASSKNLDEARKNAINSAEKELNYEVKMAAALADGQLTVKLSRNPKNIILKKGINKP